MLPASWRFEPCRSSQCCLSELVLQYQWHQCQQYHIPDKGEGHTAAVNLNKGMHWNSYRLIQNLTHSGGSNSVRHAEPKAPTRRLAWEANRRRLPVRRKSKQACSALTIKNINSWCFPNPFRKGKLVTSADLVQSQPTTLPIERVKLWNGKHPAVKTALLKHP